MTNIRLLLIGCCLFLLSACGKKTVNIVVPPEASIRMNFGVQQLQETLEKEGYRVLQDEEGIYLPPYYFSESGL